MRGRSWIRRPPTRDKRKKPPANICERLLLCSKLSNSLAILRAGHAASARQDHRRARWRAIGCDRTCRLGRTGTRAVLRVQWAVLMMASPLGAAFALATFPFTPIVHAMLACFVLLAPCLLALLA